MAPGNRPPRVLVSSYDFKFFGPVERALRAAGAVLRWDPWFGHEAHDPAHSRELMAWADVVIAEWCLGNAVFAARHVDARQRLIVRFHRFELERRFPAEVDIERVDAMVFVGPHIAAEARSRWGWPAQRCRVLPNAVDVEAYDEHKRDGAERTLGLLGWHRPLKRLDRALDLLERLRAEDPRWRLRCKGQHPWQFPWLRGDRHDRAWFEEQLARIARSDLLSHGVRFDGFGPTPSWFQDIGWILSPSDVESFHLATAEGMASTAVPVLWQRDGAEQIFPADWVHADTDAAAAAVRAADHACWRAQGHAARAFVHQHYDEAEIAHAWQRLVLDAG